MSLEVSSIGAVPWWTSASYNMVDARTSLLMGLGSLVVGAILAACSCSS